MKNTAYAMEAASFLRELAAMADNDSAVAIAAAVSKYIENAPKIYFKQRNTHIFKLLDVHPFPADLYFATDDQGIRLPFPSAWVAIEDVEGGIVGIMARHLSPELLTATICVKPPAGEWIYPPIVYVISIGRPAGPRRKEIKELLPPLLAQHPIVDVTFRFQGSRAIIDFPLGCEAATLDPEVYDQIDDAFEDFYELLFSLRQPGHALRPMDNLPGSALQLCILPEGITEAQLQKAHVLYNWLCDDEAYENVHLQEDCILCGARKGVVAGGAIVTEPMGIKLAYGVCDRCICDAGYYNRILEEAKSISLRISSARGTA